MSKEINRIVLINAPIDRKYKDSTSLFCPPLGLLSIKAYLEQKSEELEVILLDGMILSLNEILKKMKSYHPDAVGISIQLLSYKNALKISREANRHGAFVFMGGHHATQIASKIIENKHNFVNCVICGDGEDAIFRLCSGDSPENIPGVTCWDSYRNKVHTTPSSICCLDDLPNPYMAKNIDFTPYIKNFKNSSFSHKIGKYYRIYSHKGCRFRATGKRCVFCGRADEGYRFFSIQKHFKYLAELNVSEHDFVFDVGDDLCGNIRWLKDAVSYVEHKNIVLPKFGVFGRGDEITIETAQLLQRLGVADITMGVETGDNNVLNNSGKEINGSNVFYRAATTLFENGIDLTPSYVLGLPGENLKSLNNTAKHAYVLKELSISMLGHPPGEIVANLLEPIPGSNAFQLLETLFPHKYLNDDELELETMQRDYFCAVFNMNIAQYESFRASMVETGKYINNLASFSDPQGWLRKEI